MTTIKTSTGLTGVDADTILLGECFILADEEAGKEVFMRIDDDIANLPDSQHIYIPSGIPGQSIPLRNKVVCTQLETGWVLAFDKDKKVIPVTGIFRWEEKHGIKS